MKNMFLTFSVVGLSVFSGFGQMDGSLDGWLQKADSLAGLRDFENALSVLSKAEEYTLNRFGESSDEYGKVYFQYGVVLQQKGNYQEAEQRLLKCRNIWEKTKGTENPGYASCLYRLGLVYYHMGNNYEKSEKCYHEARAIQEKNPGRESVEYVNTILESANLYMYTGNFAQAEKDYLEAADLYKMLTAREDVFYSTIQRCLGIFFIKQHAYDEAIRYLQASVRTVEKEIGKSNFPYAINSMCLAWARMGKGDLTEAESLLLESKGIFESMPSYFEIPAYMSLMAHLGNLYSQMGRYGESEICHLRSKSLREAKLGKEHLSVEMSLAFLSTLYWKMGRLEDAALYFSETATRQRAHLSNAARHFSEKEVTSYLSTFGSEIDQHFSFAFDQCRTVPNVAGACFDNALFHRGFLLNTSYLVRNQAASDPVIAEQLDQLKSCQRLLSIEYAKPAQERDSTSVVQLETQANTLEKDLARTVAGFGEAIRQVSWQEVQAALKPGEAALEFVHFNYYKPEATDSVLYAALLLAPGMEQPLFLPLFEEKSLEKLLPPPGKNRSEYVSSLYQNEALTNLIWSPVEPNLQGVKTIYYAPTGLLHRLNLAALPTAAGGVFSTKYDLVQLGSTRQLAVGSWQSAPSSQRTAVVFGGIQYEMDSTAIPAADPEELAMNVRGLAFTETDSTLRGGSWKYLKNSEKESANVAAILQKASIAATAFSGYAATEEAFKKIGKNGAAPHILHVSTHGYFFTDTPQPSKGDDPVFKTSDHPMIRSGLILAGANHAWQTGKPLGKREDGILTAYEISQLDLRNTELVVLSACETGLGDIRGNEGVYGLQRAFKIAGAKNLIMSPLMFFTC